MDTNIRINIGSTYTDPREEPPPKNVIMYKLPVLKLLHGIPSNWKDTTRELQETALNLQEILRTLGVNVTILGVCQGPSITRYELMLEKGVRISKIMNLKEDIKMGLSATDIEIVAPIPGKSAIGIDVPNKEKRIVTLLDSLATKAFENCNSKIAFVVGQDISGQTIVEDLDKMPNLLITGSKGSGKSMFINTLIMSILYKAKPDEVKFIMIDPKVIDLTVYNGIPHLMIPVLTDSKKASAALHWGTMEMEDRQRKFADLGVRNLEDYNRKIQEMPFMNALEPTEPLPQIVIIIDELAELMMDCPKEIEDSIYRITMLANAVGIHLIISTQHPKVDAVSRLINTCIPSRIAFATSSSGNSRTIPDIDGAEKLLGSGDMLFYPKNYPKPIRAQGAFVSDDEIHNVIDYLKNQNLYNTCMKEAWEIEQKMQSMSSGRSDSNPWTSDDGRDELFREAGKLIIDKDKASIAMLQRIFKIGFNRAERIVVQLCEYGVVSEEDGTKPRKVLMTLEQFEQLLDEI